MRAFLSPSAFLSFPCFLVIVMFSPWLGKLINSNGNKVLRIVGLMENDWSNLHSFLPIARNTLSHHGQTSFKDLNLLSDQSTIAVELVSRARYEGLCLLLDSACFQ
jgi:hypothetical protein